MLEPLVSVVIPVYNTAAYLNKCVQSVVDQTYQKLEIILVDDGSADESPRLCDQWAAKDSRIKVVHKQNQGLGMARNTGLDLATGAYICFFDGDDYVDLQAIELCVQNALQNNTDVVMFGLCDVQPDGSVVTKQIDDSKPLFAQQEVINDLLPSMFVYGKGFGVSACGKMYRLDTLKKQGQRFLSEREVVSEDAIFALDFYPQIASASIVGRCLYYYVKRENSLTRTYRPDRQARNDLFLSCALQVVQNRRLPGCVADVVKARYQMYSMAAMKQTVTAPLPPKEQAAALNAILKSPILRTTLDASVLQWHNRNMRLFFVLLKAGCYGLCKWMLRYKTGRE